MARLGIFVLVFSFVLSKAGTAVSASTTTSSPTDYIVASCKATRAQSTAAYVAKMTQVRGIKPSERQVVKDCIENMCDSVDRLSQSVKELSHIGRAAVGRVMDGNIKVAVRRRVVHVTQVTGNALALVNRFAAGPRPAKYAEKP
ncbi:hypothetical protein V6N13_076991 [Hibiscus sabdariffa]|uniref:Pectinesterase inhibitor domain-containing protein n=1 Tax=Hibiscus sabdariffa TaxID=183260 RepID=A0ABR2CMJ0_9ROSI